MLEWYESSKRSLPWRLTDDPYEIWISEVMLQQTQVNTVIPYYKSFLKRFPDLRALSKAAVGNVLKQWEGLGYYSRARNLHSTAREIQSKYGGKFPSDVDALLALPGIGEYTASAIASIAFGQPTPVVDGNVWRVFSRILLLRDPPNSGKKKIRKFLEKLILTSDPTAFNQAIMELGALVCTPKHPACSSCPVQSFCGAFKRKSVENFPMKILSKKLSHCKWVSSCLIFKNEILLKQRPARGLWGGLWECPSALFKNKKSGLKLAHELTNGTSVDSYRELKPIKHTLSHFKLTLHPIVFELNNKFSPHEEYKWDNLNRPKLPLPVPYLKILQAIVSLRKSSCFKA